MARHPDPHSPSEAFVDVAESVYQYAHRWAINQAPGPEDARVLDSCSSILAELSPRIDRWAHSGDPFQSATNLRSIRHGTEPLTEHFTLPLNVDDVVVTLHRFARRYANGRGTYGAAIVNDAARQLRDLGLDLAETQRLDGTIWAMDGADGEYDGLDDEQRREVEHATRMRRTT